ncbi:hypothetical protein BV898_09820 [Hypsibius exemplaris]|uniref:Uncharacterized protein n=1 Tax=Hypsibius exemplaris TaxID=2072580 RepID=A0A1W0WLG2_HYPEX|nr:hypothetical protein BV898_09820 [Hypsibius exemplaris]
MADKTSIQFVTKFVEFAIPSLLEYPIDFQLFLSRICSLVALEVSHPPAPLRPQTSTTNGFTRSATDRLSMRRTGPTVTDSLLKNAEAILTASYPDEEITRRDVKPGVARYRVPTEQGTRLFEFSALLKEVAPEQVRLFLSDGLIKAKATSGVLLSTTGISGAQRLDLFGVPVGETELIPVMFIGNVAKDAERLDNALKLADEVIRFLIKSDEQNTDRESVAKIYSVMPRILHVISTLLAFMESHAGANLRAAAGPGSSSSNDGGTSAVITRITTTPVKKTVITRTVTTATTSSSERMPTTTTTSSNIPGIATRTITSVRGGPGQVTTERSFLTSQMRSMSMPKRFGKDSQVIIQRELERFNRNYPS